AATGQPTPVRICLTGPDGRYYPPFGRLGMIISLEEGGGNVCLNDANYAYIDGTCEVRLPAGPIHVRISKGFEYTPIRREVTLGAGQMALRWVLERWVD